MINEEHLQYLLDLNFQFIPLHGKIPVTKDWTSHGITDPQTITISKKNWGVNCGLSGLFVIDVDVKPGKDGLNELNTLEEHYGKLPETLTVSTPSGGRHLYFRGRGKSTVGVLAPSVDTRSVGGQVVSTLSDGYDILHDNPIATLPNWVLTALNTTTTDNVNIENLEIPEGERNSALTREAGFLRGRGYTRDMIYDIMHQINEECCDTPVSEEELTTIVDSISRYEPEDAKTKAQEKLKSEKRLKDFELYKLEQGDSVPLSSSELTGKAPKREWAVAEWLPIGEICSVYGSGGSGKSLIAMQLAYAVAHGGQWLGLDIEKQMPVLGVFCEDDIGEIHRRLNAIRKSRGIDVESNEQDSAEAIKQAEKGCLKVWSRVGHDTALVEDTRAEGLQEGKFYALVEEYLASMPKGDKLLILDTLSDVFLASENDREVVNRFIKYHLGRLAQKYQLTTLLIAHPSRSGVGSGDLLSGSTAWENSVRSRLVLCPKMDETGNEIEGLMAVRRSKSNYAKRGEEIVVEWVDHVFERADDKIVELQEEVEGGIEAVVSSLAYGRANILVSEIVAYLRDNDPKAKGVKTIRNQILYAVRNSVRLNADFNLVDTGTESRPKWILYNMSDLDGRLQVGKLEAEKECTPTESTLLG